VLLDTHVWIWLVMDAPGRLGPRTRRRLMKAAGAAAPHVSAVSALEIAALHVTGRLHLTQPVDRWIRESIARAGFRVVDLDAAMAIDAGLVPPKALPDPIDRCLVATAREYQMPLATCDRRILQYAAKTGLVQAIDASA
jgi:PIN domain nuclease of toxin-antitoxin system